VALQVRFLHSRAVVYVIEQGKQVGIKCMTNSSRFPAEMKDAGVVFAVCCICVMCLESKTM